MSNQFYCRLSSATLLTLMLVLYYHLEERTVDLNTKHWNSLIEDKIVFLSLTTKKAISLLENSFTVNQAQSYVCSKNIGD